MSIRLPEIFLYPLFLLLVTAVPGFAQTADFSASPVSGCSPLVVNFTDLSTGGPVSTYSWNLGNSVTSTLQHPSTTYTSPGTYSVTLTVTGPGGSSTKTISVIVFDQPAVSFSATTALTGCTPHYVQFSSTVTPNSPGTVIYNWDFGDGTTGTGANPDHMYNTAGVYTVLLSVTNGAGCATTIAQNAYITAYPVVNGGFSASQTYFCSLPATATFTNTSTGGTPPFTTSWDFGDGTTGSGNAAPHTYTTSGSFTVTMITTDARGCSDTVVKASYITVIGTLPTFISPPAVCERVKATFINNTMGYSATSWDFGDGDVDLTSNIADHAYMVAGTYNVTMTTVIAGCTKTLTKPIQIDPKPRSTVTMTPPVPCPPPVTVSFSANSVVPSTTGYDWSWLNGGTASGQTVNKFYPANIPGFHHDAVTLITTSAAGCRDTLRIDTVFIRDILVSALPGGDVCAPSRVRGCFPLKVHFYTDLLKSNLPPPPPPATGCDPEYHPLLVNSWLWDFGDGSPTSILDTPSHVYANAGDYRVKVIITTPNGCIDSGFTQVHADTPVPPSFTVSPLAVCQNSRIDYTNTTTNILSGTIFQWIVAAPQNREVDSTLRFVGPHAYSMIRKPGAYNVYLYSDHYGCMDSFVRLNHIVVYPPDAKFIDSPFCAPSYTTVKFINTSDSTTSQFWKFGDGDTSTAFSPTHTYPGLGHYFVTLIVHNNIHDCYDTLVRRIQLFVPSFDFKATDSSICVNEGVQFEASYFGYGIPTYSFSSDGITTPFDTLPQAIFRYFNRGNHDVTLYLASGNGCFDTLTKPAFILASSPRLKYSVSPPIGCMPLTVTFRDSSDNVPGISNVSRFWVFGDGDTLTTNQATITHTYTTLGRDTIQLIVTDSLGCKSDVFTGFQYLSVHKPKATYTVSDTGVCTYEEVRFNDTSAVAGSLGHRWSFGDGQTDTGVSAMHRYTAPGRYNVRLIVTDSVGCMDTLASYFIQVNAPYAAFSVSDTLAICPPLLVRFANQSTAASTYRWDFGNGSAPVVVTNPVTTYANPGVFNVTLVATDLVGCTDTATAQVRVLGYSGAFSYTPLAGCAPVTVTFTTPITGIPFITWDFADGSTTTTSGTTTTHTYLSAGPYLPKVIFSDGAGCSSPSFGLDTIKVDQVNAAFGWSVPCVGTPFTLTDSSTALYTAPGQSAWYFGSSDTAAGSPVSYTFPTPGNHPVTLVAANTTGCRDTITRDVFINPLPEIRVSDDTSVCPNDKISLLAMGGASYTWSPAPDSMNNCPVCDIAFVHLDSAAGGTFRIITVTGTDGNGCVNKDSVRVSIQLRTEYSTGVGGDICVGESFRLHAEGAHKYEWLPAATLDSPFIASPLASPRQTTTYIVAAREGSCDIDSQSVTVVVHSLPLFSAGNDEIIALGSAVTLKPTKIGISRIEWAADTTLTCLDCFDPAAHPHYTRTYYATGYNEFGCPATDSVTVHVRCNGSLVFIPNTFTPNGDGLNDYFFPRGDGIERMSVFRIYNRWGELVFERSNAVLNDERGGWDGSFKGKSLAPDVYMYIMQSTCSSGDIIEWKGDVTIMR